MEQQQLQKPTVIFLLGGPGSGKGTQSAIMVERYNFIHYSTGDLLREFIQTDCQQAIKIKQLLRQGKLAPSEMLVDIVKRKIFENGPNNNIYLLDGFPRSVGNYDAWKEVMKDDVQVKILLNLDCTLETLEKRLLERGKTSQREDDNRETILKRFKTFKDQTQPFLAYYQSQVGHIYRVNGQHPVQEVTKIIKNILTEEKLI